MACRVQQYAPTIRPGLHVRAASAQPERLVFADIQIGHHEVEVNVFRGGAIRPGRHSPAR